MKIYFSNFDVYCLISINHTVRINDIRLFIVLFCIITLSVIKNEYES